MKSRLAAATALLAFALSTAPAFAQSADLIDGVVTKVDAEAQKITIKHGPLKKFDMDDGMTMVFRAQDPTMLKAVKAGDKVKFVPDRINGQFTVTKIEKAR
jgi:Cu/Ag efflux protein CusF